MSDPSVPGPPLPEQSLPVPPSAERMAGLLATIAAQARRTNLVRVAEIRAAVQRASTAGLDQDGWAVAEQTAHQLAGSAGTFGYVGASDLARNLEHRLALLAGGAVEGQAESLDQALGLLDELSEQLSGEPELD